MSPPTPSFTLWRASKGPCLLASLKATGLCHIHAAISINIVGPGLGGVVGVGGGAIGGRARDSRFLESRVHEGGVEGGWGQSSLGGEDNSCTSGGVGAAHTRSGLGLISIISRWPGRSGGKRGEC